MFEMLPRIFTTLLYYLSNERLLLLFAVFVLRFSSAKGYDINILASSYVNERRTRGNFMHEKFTVHAKEELLASRRIVSFIKDLPAPACPLAISAKSSTVAMNLKKSRYEIARKKISLQSDWCVNQRHEV